MNGDRRREGGGRAQFHSLSSAFELSLVNLVF